MDYLSGILEQLSPANRPKGFAQFLIELFRELAKGRAVSKDRLAAALDWPMERMQALLEQTPETEYDDQGDIVGYGITLRETPHLIEISGRHLYTWCALDALMFPPLIAQHVRVKSHCPVTGILISFLVTPNQISQIEPKGAVISLLRPARMTYIRTAFCCYVHFFASANAAGIWLSQQNGAQAVSIEDAFRLAQKLRCLLAQDAGVSSS